MSQSIALDRRRRSRTAIPASRTATPISTTGADNEALALIGIKAESKKAEQYLKDIKKPNIHIAIYYPGLCKEYGLLVNFNILISEDKHRAFKKWIYSTNHRYPEKDLLIKENLRQTLRLVLANGFREEKDEIATQLVKDIYASCPILFATLLPRSEQAGLEAIADDDDDDELEGIAGDAYYVYPTAVGCIQSKYDVCPLLSLPAPSLPAPSLPTSTLVRYLT